MLSQSDLVKLTAKQSNIYAWGWHPQARHRVAVCGRRFGKTFLAAREMKRAAKLAAKWRIDPVNELWYGSPTFKQAKRVFWNRLKRAIPRHWLASKPNETECYLTLKTGHILRIVGLDNADALRGSGLFFFIGDEWQDAKPECWTEVISPMLATCKGNSLFIGTPKGFNHFYDDFNKGQEGGEPDYKSFQYTSIQGGNIPDDEVEKARRQLDARTFKQEWEAGFVDYSGRIMHAFERIHNVRRCDLDPSLPLHIGMDFNVNPMTATVWQELRGLQIETYGKRNGWTDVEALAKLDAISVQVDEVIIPTANTDIMADEIISRYARAGSVAHVSIYPDASGAANRTSAQGRTDIGILRSRNFNVVALSSNPLVRDRHNTSNARFCNAIPERRAFVDPRNRKSIECYERFVYKEGTSEPDKTEGYDHACDATGYYFFARFGASKVVRAKVGY